MSRCAHSKSIYNIRKLPKCSRCGGEFTLVYSSYDKAEKPVYEWECMKCHKVVAKDSLKEEELSAEDKRLSEAVKRLQKESKKN